MNRLFETQQALAGLGSNVRIHDGIHPTGTIHAGTQGLYVGSETYDPVRHSPMDIDPLSPFAITFGADQVSLVMPEKPLTARIVIDATPRREMPAVTEAKAQLAYGLHEAVSSARPGINDRLYSYVALDQAASTDSVPFDFEVLEVGGAEDVQEAAAALAMRGLTFVISDFARWRAPGRATELNNVIAVKVNHQAERYVPAGIGVVSLGGRYEVNTNKPKQLRQVNTQLHAEHERIVGVLEGAGAAVAEVVVSGRNQDGEHFDVEAADEQLAQAIRQHTA